MLLVVDIGGSSAEFALFNQVNAEMLFSETLNTFASPISKTQLFVAELVAFISKNKLELNHLLLASAGLSDPAVKALLLRELQAKLNVKISLHTDAELALWNVASENSALCLILGTGSIFIGRDSSGKHFRYGGNGYLVDEISGAFTLAQNFLKHALSDPKYLGDAQVFCEKAKAEKLSDILPRIYRNENPVRQMAALAPFVLDCAERDKNGLAAHVVENYLRKISDESLAIFEKEKLHERRLFSTGGLLKNKYFCTLLEAILKQEKIQFSAVLRSNCYGGLKLSQLGE